jgi:hypothetical protein
MKVTLTFDIYDLRVIVDALDYTDLKYDEDQALFDRLKKNLKELQEKQKNDLPSV